MLLAPRPVPSRVRRSRSPRNRRILLATVLVSLDLVLAYGCSAVPPPPAEPPSSANAPPAPQNVDALAVVSPPPPMAAQKPKAAAGVAERAAMRSPAKRPELFIDGVLRDPDANARVGVTVGKHRIELRMGDEVLVRQMFDTRGNEFGWLPCADLTGDAAMNCKKHWDRWWRDNTWEMQPDNETGVTHPIMLPPAADAGPAPDETSGAPIFLIKLLPVPDAGPG
ncbi:MAG: hypothetical protein ABI193_12765 [Minicystis sp.]